MSHRGENGCGHELDFGPTELVVSLHASTETVELAIEADHPRLPVPTAPLRPCGRPGHLFSKTMADLARQDWEWSAAERR
jgi:hypothetical protein